MKNKYDNFKKYALKYKLSLIIFFILGFALSAILYRSLKNTIPPNLCNCNRIEFQYLGSKLNHFIPDTELQKSILNSEERNYIKSSGPFIVNDRQLIKNFAYNVSKASYSDRLRGMFAYSDPIHITCYDDSIKPISFTLYGEVLVTKDSRIFKCEINLANLIEPPEMQAFKLRFQCALNLARLYAKGPMYRKKVNLYPDPNQWCEVIVDSFRNEYSKKDGTKKRRYSDDYIYKIFTCQSAHEYMNVKNTAILHNESNLPEQSLHLMECHYAMNPNCEPDSPGDMVLLFETKAGWNQHGGPELFTFDNHNPRGGCVLLNDGTVKFIRTEAELQKLKWK